MLDYAKAMDRELELAACVPHPVHKSGFNTATVLPYGLTVEHVFRAMQEFNHFLGFINQQLYTKEIPRLESMLMPANFSSIVGEFMSSSIPKHYPAIVKNRYHNGHPDLVPAGHYAGDSIQHGDEGIEIKASRYLRGWQGHNPEDTWLMVFVFDSNRPIDEAKGIAPKPYRFVMVAGARLAKTDWLYAGRSETSRRTITASVTRSGYEKMMNNWIYKDPCYISKRRGSLRSD
ncbi:MAG TPA: hypothetical protein VKA70_16010 [Blastocatellia bacterium]|nr:hypothetical protein [Blastocatellia bacterium]